jgi:hypothetical protein
LRSNGAGRFADRTLSVTITEIPVSIKRVLVLEDNFIIAMEAEDILRSIGIDHIVIAGNVAEARPFPLSLPPLNLRFSLCFCKKSA